MPSTQTLIRKNSEGMGTTTKTLKRQSNVQTEGEEEFKIFGDLEADFYSKTTKLPPPPPSSTKQLLPVLPEQASNNAIPIPNINESVAERNGKAKVNGYIVNSTVINWINNLNFDTFSTNYVCNVSVIEHPDFPNRKDIARVNTLGPVKHLTDRGPRDDYLSIIVTSVYKGTPQQSFQWYMEAEPNEKSLYGLQCYSFVQKRSDMNVPDIDRKHPIYPLIQCGSKCIILGGESYIEIWYNNVH